MTQERVKGFVVGLDQMPGGKKVWKVQIKQDGQPKLKMCVESVRDDVVLVAGLDVDFIVGTGSVGWRTIPVAVDVRLLTPAQVDPPETINLFVSDMEGRINVFMTHLTSIEEVKNDVEDSGERVVAFVSLTEKDVGDKDIYAAAFGFLQAMSRTDDVRDSFELFLTHVFVLGATYERNNQDD
jgi:hypothetical protein